MKPPLTVLAAAADRVPFDVYAVDELMQRIAEARRDGTGVELSADDVKNLVALHAYLMNPLGLDLSDVGR